MRQSSDSENKTVTIKTPAVKQTHQGDRAAADSMATFSHSSHIFPRYEQAVKNWQEYHILTGNSTINH